MRRDTFGRLGGTFIDKSGSYYNDSIELDVFFRFAGVGDSGGADGTYSGSFCFSTSEATCGAPSPVPLPAAAWLLLSGLGGLGLLRRFKAN